MISSLLFFFLFSSRWSIYFLSSSRTYSIVDCGPCDLFILLLEVCAVWPPHPLIPPLCPFRTLFRFSHVLLSLMQYLLSLWIWTISLFWNFFCHFSRLWLATLQSVLIDQEHKTLVRNYRLVWIQGGESHVSQKNLWEIRRKL